jgi:hypothetical protein
MPEAPVLSSLFENMKVEAVDDDPRTADELKSLGNKQMAEKVFLLN